MKARDRTNWAVQKCHGNSTLHLGSGYARILGQLTATDKSGIQEFWFQHLGILIPRAAPRHAPEHSSRRSTSTTPHIPGRAKLAANRTCQSSTAVHGGFSPTSFLSLKPGIHGSPFQECQVTTGYGCLCNDRVQVALGH